MVIYWEYENKDRYHRPAARSISIASCSGDDLRFFDDRRYCNGSGYDRTPRKHHRTFDDGTERFDQSI